MRIRGSEKILSAEIKLERPCINASGNVARFTHHSLAGNEAVYNRNSLRCRKHQGDHRMRERPLALIRALSDALLPELAPHLFPGAHRSDANPDFRSLT